MGIQVVGGCDVDPAVVAARARRHALEREETGGEIVGGKARVGHNLVLIGHWRTAFPSMKWIPHSSLSDPRQRPARGSSPGLVAEVQGAHPTD